MLWVKNISRGVSAEMSDTQTPIHIVSSEIAKLSRKKAHTHIKRETTPAKRICVRSTKHFQIRSFLSWREASMNLCVKCIYPLTDRLNISPTNWQTDRRQMNGWWYLQQFTCLADDGTKTIIKQNDENEVRSFNISHLFLAQTLPSDLHNEKNNNKVFIWNARHPPPISFYRSFSI